MAQELLAATENNNQLRSISVQPSNDSGVFRISLSDGIVHELVWDRKTMDGFPDVDELRVKLEGKLRTGIKSETAIKGIANFSSPSISIFYSTESKYLARSVFYSLELLSTFPELRAFTLIPNRVQKHGFKIMVDDDVIWNTSTMARFPKAPELKQLVRDLINPNKSLGHSDNKEKTAKVYDNANSRDRRFFGVS